MPKAIKTRNAGTMTEAAFWNMFKNALRKLSMYWKPNEGYLKTIRKPVTGKRHKFEYPCADCGNWFKREEVERDHIVPCGHINSFESIGEVARRMFIEIDGGWQCLCKNCHKIKSLAGRGNKEKKC